MTAPTLLRQQSPLAHPSHQLAVLQPKGDIKPFYQALSEHDQLPLKAEGVHVLQVNVGKLCNQTCRHCHVDAGPDRREVMTLETMAACLHVLDRDGIPVLDITGGAPELNPSFRWFVTEARQRQKHVIDRCNLTVLTMPGFETMPEFLAQNSVEIVASLPCYLAENTNAQRGARVFERSVDAVRRLNALGYGRAGSGLVLNLVYNPVGPHLPPSQAELEDIYRRELLARYGLEFNRLFTITNMPISRFLAELLRTGEFDRYMQRLNEAFNPSAISGLMCRTTLSVGWDGRLYDCDFNQMLELGLEPNLPQMIHDFDIARLASRRIMVDQHCFGCTAGSGSTCQGAIVKCTGTLGK
ncbi:MAG TPA: arsenosugar biosynthesis radical SAM (seleno)protein ArsS [Pirellulales bacterium]|jgi:radical SAM/Cys-rich protein|nr:arsenosugar biosynthesis radical SAM (seleno)protein ArsS [Pirellulales bacterium]